jgi:hypothetical protein
VCFAGTENLSIPVHAIAVIGTLHIFMSVLMAMAASNSNVGHRKCINGIYLITFIPAGIYVQVTTCYFSLYLL